MVVVVSLGLSTIGPCSKKWRWSKYRCVGRCYRRNLDLMDYTAPVSVLYFFKFGNLSYLLHILAFFPVCVLLFFSSSSFFASTFFDRYILLQATGNERRSWKAWGLDYTWGRLCRRRRRRTAMPATAPHCYWALGPPPPPLAAQTAFASSQCSAVRGWFLHEAKGKA